MNITTAIIDGIKTSIGQAGDYFGLICFLLGLVIMVVTIILSPKIMKKEKERQQKDTESPTKTYTDERHY